MKTLRAYQIAVLLGLAVAAASLPARLAAAENLAGAVELVRNIYVADREAFVAENLQLTEQEAAAFWPLYDKYRVAREQLGDSLVKLVLEYADAYPNVPEDRARQLLKDYSALEKKLASNRSTYLKKFAKILPQTKALRFAQLEARMDLVLRLQLASKIPLVPTEGRLSATSGAYVSLTAGVPGGTFVQDHQLIATVTSIDKASRKVTLQGLDGIKQTVKVGPDVINLEQVNVGDRLKVTATEELVVTMAAPGESGNDGATGVVALAPKGAKPGGVLAETVQLTATVTAIDQQERTATLKFEDGSTRTFHVRRDVDLSRRQVGAKVVFRATEMVALSVEKQ